MSKKRYTSSSPSVALSFFRSIFFIVFAVVIAYVVSQHSQTSSPLPPSAATSTSAASGSTSASKLLLVNGDSLTLLSSSVPSQRMTTQQFQTTFAKTVIPQQGVSVVNGVSVNFVLPGAPKPSAGVRSSDGKIVAHLVSPQSDGTPVLALDRDQGATNKIVLRLPNGNPLTQAIVYGWFTPTTLAVVAQSTSTRWVYAVSADGKIAPLEAIPDSIIHIEMRANELWYITATQGEGIESPPSGPSEVHRVRFDATLSDEQLFRADRQVVLNVTSPGSNQPILAYTLDDGQSYLISYQDTSKSIPLGTRRPLVFLPEGFLVLRNGFSIEVFDPKTQLSKTIGTVPEGSVNLFVLP